VPGKVALPSVDVVICCYTFDRWDLITRAVASVVAQSVLPERLIISVDHNEELFERCRAEWESAGERSPIEFIVVANQFAGRLGSTRNTALLHCRADVVAFLDDDAEAVPDWLERILDVYASHPEAVAVGGAPIPNYGAPRPSWFPTDFDWVFGCHYRSLPTHLAPVRHLIGANMSVRRDDILAVGGFHADDHDDMDLSHRIAHQHGQDAVLYEPLATVRHFVSPGRLTWDYFWRRCFYVNRSKVGAFAELGEGGNLSAELRFVVGVMLALFPALRAAMSGKPERLRQAVVAVAGVGLAGAGHLAGRVRLARNGLPQNPTPGLTAADVERARASSGVPDDA